MFVTGALMWYELTPRQREHIDTRLYPTLTPPPEDLEPKTIIGWPWPYSIQLSNGTAVSNPRLILYGILDVIFVVALIVNAALLSEFLLRWRKPLHKPPSPE